MFNKLIKVNLLNLINYKRYDLINNKMENDQCNK